MGNRSTSVPKTEPSFEFIPRPNKLKIPSKNETPKISKPFIRIITEKKKFQNSEYYEFVNVSPTKLQRTFLKDSEVSTITKETKSSTRAKAKTLNQESITRRRFRTKSEEKETLVSFKPFQSSIESKKIGKKINIENLSINSKDSQSPKNNFTNHTDEMKNIYFTGIINRITGNSNNKKKPTTKKLPIHEEEEVVKLWKGKERNLKEQTIMKALSHSTLKNLPTVNATARLASQTLVPNDFTKSNYFLKPSLRKSKLKDGANLLKTSFASSKNESFCESPKETPKKQPKMSFVDRIRRLKDLTGLNKIDRKPIKVAFYKEEFDDQNSKSNTARNINKSLEEKILFSLISRGFPPTYYYIDHKRVSTILSDNFTAPLNDLSVANKLKLATLTSRKKTT